MADVQVVLSGDDAALFRAFQRIVDQQAKTEAGYKKIKQASKEATDESKKGADSIKDMGASIDLTVDKLGGFVAGFVSVQAAAQVVSFAYKEQVELQREALELSQRVAASQQEAAKNLTGISDAQTRSVLGQRAPAIASQTGFPDIAKLTDAIGAAFSASGDLEKSLSAVSAAAELTRLTTDQITTVASGALDVARGSGIADARQNLAFLLSAGKSARIEDPAKLAGTIAPTVASGVSTVPQQNREQAAREIAALFTTLNQQATDKSGDSTRTAVTTLLARMESFFSGKEGDPGTVAGRLQRLQQDAELRSDFFAKPFGEVAFQKGFELVATAGSDLAASFAQSSREISFNIDTFNEKVRQLQEATPQLATATALAKTNAAIGANQFGDVKGATTEAILKIREDVLKQTSTGFLTSFDNQIDKALTDIVPRSQLTPAFAADNTIAVFKDRIEKLQLQGDTPENQTKIDLLNQSIEQLQTLLQRQQQIVDQAIADERAPLQTFEPETDSRKQVPLPYGSFDIPGQMSVDAFENRQFYAQSADRFDFPGDQPTGNTLPTSERLPPAQLRDMEFELFQQMKRMKEASKEIADQLERAAKADKAAGKRATAATAGRP